MSSAVDAQRLVRTTGEPPLAVAVTVGVSPAGWSSTPATRASNPCPARKSSVDALPQMAAGVTLVSDGTTRPEPHAATPSAQALASIRRRYAACTSLMQNKQEDDP